MTLHYKNIKFLALLYAGIPIVIFMLGWLNIIFAALFSAVFALAIIFSMRKMKDDDGEIKEFKLSKKKFFIIIAIALLWCILAGQGGFVHQTSDQEIRNAILYDLIVKPWPVTYNNGEAVLSYYITHWMVPAVFGKLVFFISGGSCFAAYLAGNIALCLWSSFGVALVLLLFSMMANTGKKSYPIMAVIGFIFFSGLDIIGSVLLKSNISGLHLEWWVYFFQYSSNTTCLFWVYNQTIVTWLMMLIIINEKKMKDLAVAGIMIFPYGPFPFVGAFVICIIKVIEKLKNKFKEHELGKGFKDLFSPQNLMSVLSVAPVFILYFISNQIVSNQTGSFDNTGLRLHDNIMLVFNYFVPSWKFISRYLMFILKYILFVILEFGIFTFIMRKNHKNDILFLGINISLLIIPLIQIGEKYDFSMRVSIPGIEYICLMFFRYIFEKLDTLPKEISFKTLKKQFSVIAAIVLLTIGAITPAFEFGRETSLTFINGIDYEEQYSNPKSFDNMDYGYNFTNEHYKDSAFYKISRH